MLKVFVTSQSLQSSRLHRVRRCCHGNRRLVTAAVDRESRHLQWWLKLSVSSGKESVWRRTTTTSVSYTVSDVCAFCDDYSCDIWGNDGGVSNDSPDMVASRQTVGVSAFVVFPCTTKFNRWRAIMCAFSTIWYDTRCYFNLHSKAEEQWLSHWHFSAGYSQVNYQFMKVLIQCRRYTQEVQDSAAGMETVLVTSLRMC